MAHSCWCLGAADIHVWHIALTRSAEELGRLTELLAAGERDRAERYRHQPSREQFITARACLRILLGRYLGLDPTHVQLEVGSTGKPRLPGGGLYFNVTHSHEVGLIAFTRRAEVGIDVERVRAYPGHLDMADRYFTPREVTALERLPPGAREHAFYHIWTRKEAFLKATALGLSYGLERFEVSVPPDDPARILHIDGDHAAAARWSITALSPASGYVGALAIEGTGHRIVAAPFDEVR